jgi:hypothetical protein
VPRSGGTLCLRKKRNYGRAKPCPKNLTASNIKSYRQAVDPNDKDLHSWLPVMEDGTPFKQPENQAERLLRLRHWRQSTSTSRCQSISDIPEDAKWVGRARSEGRGAAVEGSSESPVRSAARGHRADDGGDGLRQPFSVGGSWPS